MEEIILIDRQILGLIDEGGGFLEATIGTTKSDLLSKGVNWDDEDAQEVGTNFVHVDMKSVFAKAYRHFRVIDLAFQGKLDGEGANKLRDLDFAYPRILNHSLDAEIQKLNTRKNQLENQIKN